MKLTHKRGDTLDLSGTIQVDPNTPDMTGWTIAAQVRMSDAIRSPIQQLECSFIDAATGMANLRATAEETELWPIGILLVDIRVTSTDGVRVTSPTFQIEVVEDITHG